MAGRVIGELSVLLVLVFFIRLSVFSPAKECVALHDSVCMAEARTKNKRTVYRHSHINVLISLAIPLQITHPDNATDNNLPIFHYT